jgi:predicted nucleotidyltransferase
VKYHPDPRGDRQLFGQTYRQNTVVSKSFGILAGRPECYAVRAGEDLLAIIARIIDAGAADLFGVTGSFLVGCFNARSDIDLVCYGQAGYEAAHELFADRDVIRPYAGNDLMQLYLRRAKYMAGSNFDALIRLEQRKLQGLTARAGAHINCEPLRSDTDRSFARMYAKEIGEMTLLATITDHEQGMVTPALYRINVQIILSSTVDEPDVFAPRITYLRSYLGAYTGAFRTGDTVYLSGKLVHLQDGDHDGFGIELTPWSVSKFYLANLTG